MKFLVFVEHHEGKLQKDALGVLGKAASLGEAEAVLLGSEVEGLAADGSSPRSASPSASCGFFFAPMIPFSEG